MQDKRTSQLLSRAVKLAEVAANEVRPAINPVIVTLS